MPIPLRKARNGTGHVYKERLKLRSTIADHLNTGSVAKFMYIKVINYSSANEEEGKDGSNGKI